ncbi:glycosyltransferase family 4 protein [Sphingomonas immobilis]|uniref:Glycosyltransferase family 4 protein n=1 Tax=Sphingomonas immobilis TaxID=3063997 RepID=A0ABT8ZW34_9SPHN|nr:glycosyltransferase family 4 protein [Sphingomonas sp. CA1-15]MDO7841354.1 glycosyltransferase family 4 protein [Sphingomonas sp. CA1-15]
MTVNIAVCGKFHFANYVKYVSAQGYLQKFYYAHKRATDATLGLPAEQIFNFPFKEYLVQGHGRLFGTVGTGPAHILYGAVWSRAVLSAWRPADLWHVMAHGHETAVVRRAGRDGARVLAEAVNTHPDNQREILHREAERWGVKGVSLHRSTRDARLIDEIASADRVLVPSATVARSFVERGIDAERVVKLPYAANLSRFFPAEHPIPNGDERRPLKIVCVGTIGLRKGQFHLLEACRRLGPDVVDLTLVGTVDTAVAARLGSYAGQFRHLQRVPNVEMRTLLLEHDLFVLPSLEEGLAVSICEALACGLPVVATRESGAEEMVVDGETGFLVEAGSADALAALLGRLARERETLPVIGAAAAAVTRRWLNWETYAAQLCDVYAQMGG